MNKYKVSYWTIFEADSEDEAKEGFSENVDESSIDVELIYEEEPDEQ